MKIRGWHYSVFGLLLFGLYGCDTRDKVAGPKRGELAVPMQGPLQPGQQPGQERPTY